MADTWGTRDIGRATSSVLLGVFTADGYDDTGINNTSSGFGGYQECWVSQQGSQLLHPYERIWPADEYANNKWDSMGVKWRPIADSFNAIALKINEDPDAPRQTICKGRLDSSPGDIPLYYVPAALAPANWITATPGTGPAMPAGGTNPVSSAPYFPSLNWDTGGSAPAPIKRNIQIPTNPFKPSSLDHLNQDTSKVDGTVISTLNKGLRLWNVWDIVYPDASWDRRQYLKNFGPIYGGSNSYGPIIRQSGSAGNMTVEVIANRSHATIQRMAPIGYDIGRDRTYKWVFPYVDENGVLWHDIAVNKTDCEISPYIKDFSNDPEMDPPNLGFVMDIDVSTGSGERTSFFGASGSSPNVVVEWGKRTSTGMPSPSNPNISAPEVGPVIRGFTAHLVPGKQPFLMYHNGAQMARLFLSDSPVPQDIGKIHLVVEYFGLSMFVTLNGERTVCVRGYMPSGDKKYGVYVQPNDVRIHVEQCSINFWFMPVYYDGWDPSIQSNFSIGPLVPGTIPSTPVPDFFPNDISGGAYDRSFTGGQCKITSISNFKVDPGDAGTTQSRVNRLCYEMMENMRLQSPTGPQMISWAPLWRLDSMAGPQGAPYFQQDEGHIPIMRDSRMVLAPSSTANLPIVCWGRTPGPPYYANWYDANRGQVGFPNQYHEPVEISDTQTSATIMFRTNVTHTTPVIFGFKAHNVDRRYGWMDSPDWKSLDNFVERWRIEWRPDVTTAGGRPGGAGKVMRANATVYLINPDPWVIKALAKNQMRIVICNTGYYENSEQEAANVSDAATRESLRMVLHRRGREEIAFEGITMSCSISKEAGGQISVEVSCVDPIHMLEQALLECNIRCDGLSYLMAFSEVFRTTDFAERLIIKMNAGQPFLPLSPTWARGTGVAGFRSDQIGLDLNEMIFFGYHPMHANGFELHYGQPVYQVLSQLLSIMHNPRHLPMFYYDPNQLITNGVRGAFKITRRNMNSGHVTLYEQGGTEDGLPLLANRGESAYVMTSLTSSLRSHFTILGTDRITGSATKACSMNPNWNRLATGDHIKWAMTYGHLGYRSKVLQTDIQPMMTDSTACQKYVNHAMWWLMRPPMKIQNLKVHGMIDPIAIEDGCINIVLGSKDKPTVYYNSAMIDSSVVSYDAKAEKVTSQVDVIIFPDDSGWGYGF